jgi:hypothetical protein
MRNLSPFTMIIATNYTECEVNETVARVVIEMGREIPAEADAFLAEVEGE